jgi:uncharacterized protein
VSSRSSLRELVWHPEERRLRTPLRIAGGAAILGVLTLLVTIPPVAVLLLVETTALVATTATLTVVSIAASAVGTVAGVWLAGRYLDRRRFADYGLRIDRDWWLDCGFGLALGALLMTGVFATKLATGLLTVESVGAGENLLSWVVVAVVVFVLVGVYEELLVRGYLLTNLAEGARGTLGERGAILFAVLASSIAFGALHAGNPNATLLSVFNISIAGVMLALGYVLTGELAIPVGIHVTWNLFQGTVYGFPVSGLEIGPSIVAVETTGPRLVTGGGFGPEAGVLGLGAMIAGSLLTVAWVRHRYGEVALDADVARPDLRDREG